ncbi:proteolipid protein DM alpha isoform X2 [Callorhinchus milii]|uniref:proteolipid protein DM alpha isoform X2 n=1 Tax=Callorhinchus milii TaxID=7868 RepID=UPI001C3F7514|nr:proteolipid protein DM alpha isoform X2 [Callorhinchus milii]
MPGSGQSGVSDGIQIFQYVIYGTASFFFLYGVLLLAEGFYTTSAVKEMYGEFRSTACGKCVSALFILLTYVLGVIWMGVCAASAVPVYVYYNIWATCHMMRENPDNATDLVCVDARQYGILPWTASPGKVCGLTLAAVCNSSEFNLTYHLFIVTLAGAAATVIALLTYMMATTYNYAVLKFLSREDCCTKF